MCSQCDDYHSSQCSLCGVNCMVFPAATTMSCMLMMYPKPEV